jgi:hypothetical protein
LAHRLLASLRDLEAQEGLLDGELEPFLAFEIGHDALARAELDTLSVEVMLLVGMLDGINRYRFDRDPQLLVAWNTAKHALTGPQAEVPEINPTPAPSTPPATGVAGGVMRVPGKEVMVLAR